MMEEADDSEDLRRSEEDAVGLVFEQGKKKKTSQEILKNAQRMSTKRDREENEENGEDEEDKEEFITVTRRPKRLLRSFSRQTDKSGSEIIWLESQQSQGVEVCITSKEILPKQFGLARILRTEGINNILKVTYKNPYKVFILFEKQEEAERLLNNKNIEEKGIQSRIASEVDVTYGIIRSVDLEVEETEILENLKCNVEINSIRRLNRVDNEGKWIKSETVRLCFKSSTLPPYVSCYGSRFEVEPYTFPVTQCSGCWKFGHSRPRCPLKKILCPKCGSEHENCDTQTFKCVNCKGPHMSIDKGKCPVFLKEKHIREIMSSENTTYRNALYGFLRNKEDKAKTREQNIEREQTVSNNIRNDTRYRDALLSGSHHQEHIYNNEEMDTQEEVSSKPRGQKQNKKKKSKNRFKKNRDRPSDTEENEASSESEGESSNEKKTPKEAKKKEPVYFNFSKILRKMQDIIASREEYSVTEMVTSMVKVVVEECLSSLMRFLRRGDFLNFIYNFDNV